MLLLENNAPKTEEGRDIGETWGGEEGKKEKGGMKRGRER